jgi:hemoglobin
MESTVPNDLSEAQLEQVIPTFYARARADPMIGPLFNSAIADWDHHLDRLIAFWSSVMLTSGRYKGNPMAAHLKHRVAIDPAMFDRWLALWDDVTGAMLPPDDALAESLKLGLFFRLKPLDEAA